VAIVERPLGHSLWLSRLLPDPAAHWELLDSGPDRQALERQARSLLRVGAVNRRRIAVVDGLEPPPWKPIL
jgi:hypothetical protein